MEKTINLLETLPDNKIETVYEFVRFIDSGTHKLPSEPTPTYIEKVQSMLGIAHECADPALINQEEGAFERSIAEKYASFRY